jgi:hypothetical protein
MEDLHEILHFLKKKFEETIISEKELATHIKPLINKVIWSTDSILSLQLLKTEISRKSKGRILKTEPTEKKNCVKTGFDTSGRILFEEQWGDFPTHGYIKYFTYSTATVYAYTFSRQGKLITIEFQELRDNLPIIYADDKKNGANIVQKYVYKDGKLVEIYSIWVYDTIIQSPTYHIKYDSLGTLSSITRSDEPSKSFPHGQNVIIYQKHYYSINELTDILVSEMEKEIIAQSENNTKDYLLIFLEESFNSDDWLPPSFCFFNSKEELRNNPSFDKFVDLESPDIIVKKPNSEKIAEVSRLLMQEVEIKEKYGFPSKFLIKLAKKVKSYVNTNLLPPNRFKILALDISDDYDKDVIPLMRKLYSKKELNIN